MCAIRLFAYFFGKSRFLVSISVAMVFTSMAGPTNLFASETNKPEFNQDMLNVVAELYGITEEQTILKVTRVSGSCSDDGDSGGVWVGGTGQVQGIHIGGATVNTCPTSTTWTYYQPIKDVVDEFNVTMLTAHGANAPDIIDVDCPNVANSYYGRFTCWVNDVDSQGEPQAQWSSNVREQ